MVMNILTFDKDAYESKRQDFLEKRGCKEDGHAAERVVALINKVMKKK